MKMSDGQDIYIVDHGETGKPAILLIHGGPGDSSVSFNSLIRSLKADYRIIEVDQRGCGRSDFAADGSVFLHRILEDFEEIRQNLQIPGWFILGHSFGGWIAEAYASTCADSVRGVILENPALDLRDSAWCILRNYIRFFEKSGNTSQVTALKNLSGSVDTAELLKIINGFPNHIRMEFWGLDRLSPETGKLLASMYNLPEFEKKRAVFTRAISGDSSLGKSGWRMLDNIHCPVLLLYGSEDNITDETIRDLFLKHTGNGIVHRIKGCGHYIHLGDTDRMSEEIRDFVEDTHIADIRRAAVEAGIKAEKGQYYLLSYDIRGKVRIQNTVLKEMRVSRKGITAPGIVMAGERRGYRKDSTMYDEGDDLEMVINSLGNYLGIPMAEEYRVLNPDFTANSLLSMDTGETSGGVFCDMMEIAAKAADLVKEEKRSFEQWMRDWGIAIQRRAYPDVENSFEYLCEDRQTYLLGIELPLHVLECMKGMLVFDPEELYRRYFEMILFDLLTGHKDRSMENYGLIIKKEKNCHFAPLFDNATMVKPYFRKEIYALNSLIMDRETLFDILTSDYAKYTLPFIEKICRMIPDVRTNLSLLVEEWVANENGKLFLSSIDSFLEMAKRIGEKKES